MRVCARRPHGPHGQTARPCPLVPTLTHLRATLRATAAALGPVPPLPRPHSCPASCPCGPADCILTKSGYPPTPKLLKAPLGSACGEAPARHGARWAEPGAETGPWAPATPPRIAAPPPSLLPQRRVTRSLAVGPWPSASIRSWKECEQRRHASKKTNKSKFNPTYPRFPGEGGRVLILPSYVLKQKFKKKSEIQTQTPHANIPQGHGGAQIHREPQFPPPREPGLCCSQGGLSTSVWEATWGLGDRKLGRKGGRPEGTPIPTDPPQDGNSVL